MPVLQSSSSGNDIPEAFGAPGVGTGTDVLAELERIRSNLAALAQVVEDLRTKHNTHTHNAAVAAPPAAEQSNVAYTMH
jgi:hypothetical protein